ncbi:cell division protein FtsA [Candidatus Dojkabacteria bacterium]|nr:cell division protein FtsA [Candidatus Dojkabacteria bacterium]
MKIPFLNKKKSKNLDLEEDPVFLALDIGTEYVKSVIYKVENDTANVIGYSRIPQHSKAMEGAMVINIDNVVSTCDIGIGRALVVADKVLGSKCPLPDYVTLGIAGEIVKGVCIVANYEREDPEMQITDEEIQEVVKNIKDQAFSDSVEDIAEEIGINSKKIKEINSHINSTYIDGIKVDNPIGFTGEEVTYRVYSTFAPSLHVNSLYEVAKRLELKVLTIDVQPYAISKSYKGAHKSDFSSIFIDIGGGTTDIAIVQDGGIVGTKMIAFGGRVFTRRLAKDMNLELEKAEKMKLDYSNKKLQGTTEKKIKKILEDDSRLWAEGIEISLAEFEEVEEFPAEILISGGGSELPEMYDALISYPWLTVLPFGKFPNVKHMYPKQIANINDETGLMHTTHDVVPAALTSISIKPAKDLLLNK